MKIPPIHNMIVQWHKYEPISLGIFDENTHTVFIDTTNGNIRIFETINYKSYYSDILNYTPLLYFPVKASTLDELKLEHPELFL